MRVLVACEESQAVAIAFRELGHEAYSCDVQECSGGHPEWHIIGDCRVVAKGGQFRTQSGDVVVITNWDKAIFFPECRHLCWSGERWFTSGHKDIKLREDAFEFFKWCYHVPFEELGIKEVALENSLSLFLERNGYKPDQKVHPFHFGSPFRKTICIWVRGLKPLIPDNIVSQREEFVHKMWPTKNKGERSKLRAKTDPNVARAMAEQWGGQQNTNP
jgi:hypothetical protein